MTLPRASLVRRHPLRVAWSFVAAGLAQLVGARMLVTLAAVGLVAGVTYDVSRCDDTNCVAELDDAMAIVVDRDCEQVCPAVSPSARIYRDIDPKLISDEDIAAAIAGMSPEIVIPSQPSLWATARSFLDELIPSEAPRVCEPSCLPLVCG